ncbi:MAG TPA: FAD-dependent oxidoreductase [Thermoanaerobaculia bacterium]|nr:FAD-dependent oxidoreductase [Thermoanaerobaculia bacterium]
MSMTATVSEVSELAKDIMQLTIAFPNRDFRFAPGQYVNVRFPGDVSRAYSVASAPQRPEAVQICIRLGTGAGSNALRQLKTGDRLEVDGPLGDFILPEGDNRRVVLIAGGTGVAPVRSIVLHMLAVEDGRQILVLFDDQDAGDIYAADLDPLGRSGAIMLRKGPVGELVAGAIDLIRGASIMVAGFGPFLDAVKQTFVAADLPYDDVVVESFD